jgi:hypothetical protein
MYPETAGKQSASELARTSPRWKEPKRRIHKKSNSVGKLARSLIGESEHTVEMTVTRVGPDGKEYEIPIEVELYLIPGRRGPWLEPDEPPQVEITKVRVFDDELDVKFPDLELTPDEEDQAIDSVEPTDWWD